MKSYFTAYLLTDVVSRQPDEVEDDVHVPLVVRRVLLRQYCHLQDLDRQIDRYRNYEIDR